MLAVHVMNSVKILLISSKPMGCKISPANHVNVLSIVLQMQRLLCKMQASKALQWSLHDMLMQTLNEFMLPYLSLWWLELWYSAP